MGIAKKSHLGVILCVYDESRRAIWSEELGRRFHCYETLPIEQFGPGKLVNFTVSEDRRIAIQLAPIEDKPREQISSIRFRA